MPPASIVAGTLSFIFVVEGFSSVVLASF